MTLELVDFERGPNHKWGDPKRIPASESTDGCERSERTCTKCPLVRITVHPPKGLPYRKWRHAGEEMQLDHTPPCVGGVVAMAVPI